MAGYVYRGRQKEGWPDLVTVNEAILRSRPPGSQGAMADFEWRGPSVPTCGTPAGYRTHYRLGERPCQACSEARNAQRRKSRPSRTISDRN